MTQTVTDFAPLQSSPAPHLPARRHDLVVRSLDDDGRHVVKDPCNGEYFELGSQEAFLLQQLDGRAPAELICAAFEKHFDEPLTKEDLDTFVELARSRGLLVSTSPPPLEASAGPRQSILYWRRSVFNPDELFEFVEPWLRFVWTRSFFIISGGFVILATLLLWFNRLELAADIPDAIRPQDLLLAWLVMITATTLHEFAHGLTCKHFGGEVREVGFLMMYFIPCLYCNVSDAWLMRERSKRMWIGFAGAYFDLMLWAFAIFIWRLTIPHSLLHYISWVVLSVCGVRTFFNLNPLLKLDGYYLLSDYLEIPNLRQRSWEHVMGHVRWLCWGAAPPAMQSRGMFLGGFGLASWIYSFFLVLLMTIWFTRVIGTNFGPSGAACAAAFGLFTTRGMFHGISDGEALTMLKHRPKRTAVWLIVLLTAAACLLIPVQRRASGSFEIRPLAKVEVRAPQAGYIETILVAEGDRVAANAPVARLRVPDLESRIAQKRADIAEAEAKVRLLRSSARKDISGNETVGPTVRLEEVNAAQAHVARLQEELKYLDSLTEKLVISSAIGGFVTTPRLKEKIGSYLHDGDLICTIEQADDLTAEIALNEQDVGDVQPGQPIELTARALPFETLFSKVDRIAPAATSGKLENTVTVYCNLNSPDHTLRPGMTGHARIACGRKPAGILITNEIYRRLRTEFWW